MFFYALYEDFDMSLQSLRHEGSKTLEIKHHLNNKWLMLSPYVPPLSFII